MKVQILRPSDPNYPEVARRIKPKNPPTLYVRGTPLEEILEKPRVAIVGTRRITPYGRQVTTRMAKELTEQGVVIIGGLAFGVDAAAHRACLEAGGITVAVLPSPVENPMPHSHQRLARQILEQGGTLVSTYPLEDDVHQGNFVERNSLVAALAQAVVVTEAAAKSGTRHTVEFASQHGIPSLAVPGPITSPLSFGTNDFIKSNAASVCTGTEDVLQALGLTLTSAHQRRLFSSDPSEQLVLNLMSSGLSDGAELHAQSGLGISRFNQVLSMLELDGKVQALGCNRWGIP